MIMYGLVYVTHCQYPQFLPLIMASIQDKNKFFFLRYLSMVGLILFCNWTTNSSFPLCVVDRNKIAHNIDRNVCSWNFLKNLKNTNKYTLNLHYCVKFSIEHFNYEICHVWYMILLIYMKKCECFIDKYGNLNMFVYFRLEYHLILVLNTHKYAL